MRLGEALAGRGLAVEAPGMDTDLYALAAISDFEYLKGDLWALFHVLPSWI